MADVVTKSDCTTKHKELDEDVEKALVVATKGVAAHLKSWILGSLVGVMLAGGGTLVCGVVELGRYTERVDSTSRQVEELKQNNNQKFEELKSEIRELRLLLLRPGR